jgi:hypothetical protein
MCAIVATKAGYIRFIAMFSWEHTEDANALTRLVSVIKKVPKGIDEKTLNGFYLTGHRTMVFIGQAKSAEDVQVFSSMATFGIAIKPQISFAVDVNNIVGMLPGLAKQFAE